MPAIRIGINPISWSNDDLPALGGETPLSTALSEGKDIGYEGFELNGKFPKDAKGVADVLRPYDLALVSGWYSSRLARRSVAEEIEAIAGHVELLKHNGASVLVYGEVADSIQGSRIRLIERPAVFTVNRPGRLTPTSSPSWRASPCPRACVWPTTTIWAPTSNPPKTSIS